VLALQWVARAQRWGPAMMSDPGLSSSDQWAFEIAAARLIKELRELLRDHNAAEVADLMEERRSRSLSGPRSCEAPSAALVSS
jgi:hypothetical protein